MLFKNISIIDENQEFKKNMYVATLDNKIVYVSNQAPSDEEAAKYGEVYDGSNKLLTSAFYNGHSHSAMVLLRSREDNLPLQEWLEKNCFPFEAKMTSEDCYWGHVLGLAEMARYGVVSCSDMYYHSVSRLKATSEAKMKINVCQHLQDFDNTEFKDHEFYQYTVDLVKNWQNADNGRLKVDANLHSEYITTPALCKSVAEFAKENDLILHVHLSETERETNECKERRNGLTPTQYFKEVGVLDAKCLMAHCVWVNEEDMDILKEANASMATCPASNMKLGSGFAKVPDWIKRGINVALGTDGASSNNKYNFLSDMYLMSLINKGAYGDPCAVGADQVLYIASRGGALAQGREDCGLLKEGFKADLCVFDLSEPVWYPETNYVNNLIYSGQGSDVCLTMCDGNVIYKDGVWPTIDIEKAKAEVNSIRKRIDAELA